MTRLVFARLPTPTRCQGRPPVGALYGAHFDGLAVPVCQGVLTLPRTPRLILDAATANHYATLEVLLTRYRPSLHAVLLGRYASKLRARLARRLPPTPLWRNGPNPRPGWERQDGGYVADTPVSAPLVVAWAIPDADPWDAWVETLQAHPSLPVLLQVSPHAPERALSRLARVRAL